MSLNNLQLPDILIAALYKNNLLSVDERPVALKEQVPHKQERKMVPFLGKHLKKTTVFVDYPDEVYLPESQLNFLANILKACHLTIADIAIINLAKVKSTADRLVTEMAPEKMIFFQINPEAINMDCPIPDFSIKNFQHISLLKAPALEKLNQNNEEGKLLKSKLWLCLKDFFSVSSAS